MSQTGIKCTFMRGGTSKGMFFHLDDLPLNQGERDRFLCAAIGSPDPYGRQLDGMGGGISSLSKAMMVQWSDRDDVDIEYLFAQIAVDKAEVDYGSNCGNLSAAVGMFAVEQMFYDKPDGPTLVRMFNVNTGKRIDCQLEVQDGRVVTAGTQQIAGVPGAGAAIRLDFLDPGGAGTGTLFPLESPSDVYRLDAPRRLANFSFVDAANPCIFVDAGHFGLTATELPSDLQLNSAAMQQLGEMRESLGSSAKVGGNFGEVPESVPKIAIVGPPADSQTLSGETLKAEDCDVQVRMISMGKPHLAIPLTGAMCTAVAARIPGTVVADCARAVPEGQPLRIGTPSGVVPAMAEVDLVGTPKAISASVYRTARTLMEGTVFAPL